MSMECNEKCTELKKNKLQLCSILTLLHEQANNFYLQNDKTGKNLQTRIHTIETIQSQ